MKSHHFFKTWCLDFSWTTSSYHQFVIITGSCHRWFEISYTCSPLQ